MNRREWRKQREQDKQDVLLLLQNHRGAGNAISLEALANAVGCDERQAKRLVNALRNDGELICSSTAPGENGYFLPTTEAEAADQIFCIARDAKKKFQMISRLKRGDGIPNIINQIELEFPDVAV